MKQDEQQPHYVSDYMRLVADLKRHHPLDDAMNMAVGSGEGVGQIERQIVEYFGLQPKMAFLDLGCGSGRLSAALSEIDIDYTGVDIVPDLLEYARSKSNSSFKFLLHRELSLPVEDRSLDMGCAFSVFTHLQHDESFLYLQDARRALKPGGIFVFSFLEFTAKSHWSVFESTVSNRRAKTPTHLNQFIERSVVKLWAEKLGFDIIEFVDPLGHPWGERPCGQAVVSLRSRP